MKVLLINNRHFHGGGADMVYFSTGELLEAAGHKVVYFSIHSAEAEPYQWDASFAPDLEKENKLRRSLLYFNNKKAAVALDKLLCKERFDIAHAHLMWGGMSGAIIPVLHKHHIPLVHTAHDYRLVCPAYLLKDGKGQFCERCKGGKFYQCALHSCSKGSTMESLLMSVEMYYRNRKWHPATEIDGIIFVSNFSRNKHLAFDMRFAYANTMVLYNFPNEQVNKSYDSSYDTFNSYYLFYGRLSSEKGVPTLLMAFEKYPQLHLKIVGTGPLEEELKAYCKEHHLENVEFLGYKNGNELFDLVAKAKYVCVPSECYENNPMTIVEAYSMGTPVIGAAIGGIIEVVKDGETGFAFESGNVESLLAALGKTDSIRQEDYKYQKKSALTFAKENFSRRKHIERLIGFYQDCIEKKLNP